MYIYLNWKHYNIFFLILFTLILHTDHSAYRNHPYFYVFHFSLILFFLKLKIILYATEFTFCYGRSLKLLIFPSKIFLSQLPTAIKP